MKHFQIAAAFALAFAPLAAQAQARISPVLSTTMQRTCQGETGSTVLLDASGQSAVGQPQVATDTRAFYAARDGAGYAFRQSANAAHGETVLTVNVAANGAVSNPQLSGAGFQAVVAASSSPIDAPALAYSLAQEIPERLIIGRTFAPGDQYYPEDLRATLIGQMTSAMGLPFPIRGSIDITYRGESVVNGRRAYLFEGTLRMEGLGQMQGAAVGVVLDGTARVAHDAETGLVLEYLTSQNIEIAVGGQQFQRTQTHDNYTCQVSPR